MKREVRSRESGDKRPRAPSAAQRNLGVSGILFCFLLALTVFLSGEQMERSGVFHLPCILWLLTLLFYIGKPLLHKGGDVVRLHLSRLDLFVYAFFAWVMLSICVNLLNGGAPRASLNLLSVWLSLAAAWFLFRQILHDSKTIHAVFAVLLAILLSEAFLGLFQQFIAIPATLRLFEANPQATIALVDPSIQAGSLAWERLVSRLTTAGPSGTYQLTNSLGGFLGTGLVCLLGFVFCWKKQNRNAYFSVQTNLVLLSVLAVALCFWLTKCRSAFVGVAVGGFLAAFVAVNALRSHSINAMALVLDKLFSFKHVSLIALVLLLLGGTCFLGGNGGKSVLAGAKRSLGVRVEYWMASSVLIRDYPLFGCGSGNFKQTYTRYKLPQSTEEIADPHNFLVEIAAVAGLPALFFLVVPLSTLVFRAFLGRFSHESQSVIAGPTDRQCCLIYGAGFVGCLFAFLISFHGEAPMDFMAPVFAVPAFAFVYFIAFGTNRKILETPLIPRSLLAITLIVLSVHLLAAGGISATNTAIIFWLLAALLANRDAMFQRQIDVDRKTTILTCIGLVVLLLFVYFTGMRPVLLAKTHAARADSAPQLALQERAMAADKDPFSAMHHEAWATEMFRQWLAQPSNASLPRDMIHTQDTALRLDPRSAVLRLTFAQRLEMMYENGMNNKSGDAAFRDQATLLYREAIERYPNNARYRAAFALFLLKTAPKNIEALKQRDEALRLDDLMSDTAQKLPPEIRQQLGTLPAPTFAPN